MTEKEQRWLALPVGSAQKWQRVERFVTDRKTRLFAVACCRRVWHLINDDQARRAVECTELFADGEISADAWREASEAAISTAYALRAKSRSAASQNAACYAAAYSGNERARDTRWAVSFASNAEVLEQSLQAGHRSPADEQPARMVEEAQSALFHDIFPNPFRRIKFDRRWRTSDAVGLARTIYEERTFDRLPILADALMDAGCADEQVIGHCRGPGPHVRGCWVIDLILGKT